jgi:hypothetical protein
MTSTLTGSQTLAIENLLGGCVLGTGVESCGDLSSIEAISFALTGEYANETPYCMSEVIAYWIANIDNAMPDEMRNSAAWRDLLPLAAGTGRQQERGRLVIILDWMWGTALPLWLPLANKNGFGQEWSAICSVRTAEAACPQQSRVWGPEAALAASAAALYVHGRYELAAQAAALAAVRIAWLVKETPEFGGGVAWRLLNPVALLARLIDVDGPEAMADVMAIRGQPSSLLNGEGCRAVRS